MATVSCHRNSAEQIDTHLDQVDTQTATLSSVRGKCFKSQQGIKLPQFVYPSRQAQIMPLWLSKKDLSASHRQQTLLSAWNSSNTVDSYRTADASIISTSDRDTAAQPLSPLQKEIVLSMSDLFSNIKLNSIFMCLQQQRHLLLSLQFGFCSWCEHNSIHVCTRILLILWTYGLFLSMWCSKKAKQQATA